MTEYRFREDCLVIYVTARNKAEAEKICRERHNIPEPKLTHIEGIPVGFGDPNG